MANEFIVTKAAPNEVTLLFIYYDLPVVMVDPETPAPPPTSLGEIMADTTVSAILPQVIQDGITNGTIGAEFVTVQVSGDFENGRQIVSDTYWQKKDAFLAAYTGQWGNLVGNVYNALPPSGS